MIRWFRFLVAAHFLARNKPCRQCWSLQTLRPEFLNAPHLSKELLIAAAPPHVNLTIIITEDAYHFPKFKRGAASEIMGSLMR